MTAVRVTHNISFYFFDVFGIPSHRNIERHDARDSFRFTVRGIFHTCNFLATLAWIVFHSDAFRLFRILTIQNAVTTTQRSLTDNFTGYPNDASTSQVETGWSKRMTLFASFRGAIARQLNNPSTCVARDGSISVFVSRLHSSAPLRFKMAHN